MTGAKLRLAIWSHWRDQYWEGWIPAPEDPAVGAALEHIFRFFNRVEDGDHERMLEVGYDLPSLSVGDEVELFGNGRWRVAALGWELVHGARA